MPNRRTIQFLQRTTTLEKTFVPKLIRITKDFREQFISDLEAHGEHTARANLQKQTIADKLTPLIQQIYKAAGLMGAKMTADELKTAAKQKAAGFGRNDQWIAAVINYLKIHMLGFVQDITDTMRDDIIKILQKGVDEQLTLPEIVANLRRANVIEARAKVIARTEIVRAANVGHSIGARSTPFEVNKKWNAARDSRTRHSHIDINQHMVDENDYFNVPMYQGDKKIGTEQMLYPGDPNASAGNTINCRCRVTYIPKRDSAGNLIRRNTTQAPVVPMRQVPRYNPEQIAAILKSQTVVEVK